MKRHSMLAALTLAATASPAMAMARGEIEGGEPKPVQPRRKPAAIRANLSRNHPDYGLTPQEHFARKATQ